MGYFEELETGLLECHSIASEARAKGLDPEKNIEIKITTDIASRVEGIVGPKGIESVIREMELQGMQREDIAFKITEKIAKGEIIQGNKEQLIDQAVRTGLAILTEGVLVAPTEGIAKIKIRDNPDGTNYVAVYYAGPIRSAGGTSVALSVILADIARRTAGIGDYRPLDTEIERYVEEVNIYEARVAHLQYKPSDDDVRVIVRNCPVCIDGDPTEEIEVSVHKNLERVETNRIRGGIPLVVCEGIALKAQKVLKYTKKLNLNWTWLEQIIKIKVREDKTEIKPDDGYLEGLVAGRPVFAYPSKKGGFRLRYGKTRANGIMAKSIHPTVMLLLDNFLAFGTHMKIERPGKGCVVTTCEEIEPPVVRLKDGRVMKVRTLQQVKEIKEQIEKILFLGDIVSTYGDFLKSNHPLIPVGYCQEWWRKEVEAKGLVLPEFSDALKAFEYCKEREIPLHPDYLLFWDSINIEQLRELVEWVKKGTINSDGETVVRLELPNGKEKEILEELLVEHFVSGEKVVLESNEAYTLLLALGALEGNNLNTTNIEKILEEEKGLGVLSVLTKAASVEIRAKGRTYIGARMGRPEKAKERAMDGNPNVLFPTGSPNNRSILKRYKDAKEVAGGKRINLELVRFRCKNCSNITIYASCELCGGECEIQKICRKCNKVVSTDVHCDADTVNYDRRPVDLISLIERMKKKLGFLPEDLKGVKGLSNRERVPERLEKGAIRAKHGVYVFRDGTSRFDASDVPLTHFKPNEIGLSLEKARELGYEKDYLGKELVDGEQVVPLRVQDILIAKRGSEYFMHVANAIDDMLVMIYGMPAYYNVKKPEEMIGKLCLGLSPHTSAAVLCRIIGFTDANVGYAHPFFHNAKRRNCFYPNTEITIWDEEKGVFVRKELGLLVEENLKAQPENIKKLENGVVKVDVPNKYFAYGINPETGIVELKKIKCFIKTPTQKKWIRISTTTHREMIVTDDHNVLYLKDGKLKSTEAKNMKEGMDIPICLRMNPKIREKNEINIAKELCALDSKEKDAIRIRAAPFFKSMFEKRKEELLKLLPITKFEKTPERWWTTVPLSHMEILVKKGLCNFDDLPDNSRIAMKHDNLTIPLRIKMNEDLMHILGYYVAEGHARSGRTCNQISYRICNKKMAAKLESAIKNIFGKEAYVGEEGTQIVLCSKIIHRLVSKIWNCGKNAHTKRVPTLVFSASDEMVKAFISAYFDGDGSVMSKPPRMHFYSISKGLLEDIGTLLLRFGIFCRYGQTKPRLPGKKVLERYMELGTEPKLGCGRYISLYGADLYRFAEICSPLVEHKAKRMNELRNSAVKKRKRFIKHEGKMVEIKKTGDYTYDRVQRIETFQENSPAYCLDVEGQKLEDKNVLLNNQILTIRCDGDEDSVMLLMDALLNFSRHYLSERRGGTMDAPIVLSVKLNPKEIDDEAFCMEIVDSYPLEFYKACENYSPPYSVKLRKVEDIIGKDEQYGHLPFTLHSNSINEGNTKSAYVELGSIPEKVAMEFALEERLKNVDVRDIARRLILSHFIPDIYGNLRSYSRQTFRCVNCHGIYRRVPLVGKCTKCNGNLTLTIHKGGIEKYLKISRELTEKYDLPVYLKQRLELVEKEIKNIFEDDKIKQTGLWDFA